MSPVILQNKHKIKMKKFFQIFRYLLFISFYSFRPYGVYSNIFFLKNFECSKKEKRYNLPIIILINVKILWSFEIYKLLFLNMNSFKKFFNVLSEEKTKFYHLMYIFDSDSGLVTAMNESRVDFN